MEQIKNQINISLNYKKSQFWYIDFMFGIIIFIMGFVFFVIYTNMLFNQMPNENLISTNFEAEKISEIFFSKSNNLGYFLYQNISNYNLSNNLSNNDFGVLCLKDSTVICNGLISNIYNLNYTVIKNSLGIKNDFKIFLSEIDSINNSKSLSDQIIEVISMSNSCGVGLSTEEIQSIQNKGVIAYSKDEVSKLSISNILNITDVYESFEKSSFLDSIEDYNLVILYNPIISEFSVDEKKILQDYVFSGKNIIISGNIDDEFLEIDYTNYKNLSHNESHIYLEEESIFFDIIKRGSYDYLKNSFIPNILIPKISIYNEYLDDKLNDPNSKEYHFLVNSNVSVFQKIHKIDVLNEEYITIFIEKYGFGKVIYFYDLFDNSNITSIVKDIIENLDNRMCELNGSNLINSDYKKISMINRIGKFSDRLVKLSIISYE